MTSILRQHPRQRNVIRNSGGEQAESSACFMHVGRTGEFGDEEEEEGYV